MKSLTHISLNNGDSISCKPGQKLYAKDKGYYAGKFMLTFSDGMINAVKEAKEALPTLTVLIANLEQGNLVRMRASLIAHIIGVSLATVYRQLKELQQAGIIEPDPAEGEKPRAVFNWRISPHVAWTGSTDLIPAYLKQLPLGHRWKTTNKIKELEDNEVTNA